MTIIYSLFARAAEALSQKAGRSLRFTVLMLLPSLSFATNCWFKWNPLNRGPSEVTVHYDFVHGHVIGSEYVTIAAGYAGTIYQECVADSDYGDIALVYFQADVPAATLVGNSYIQTGENTTATYGNASFNATDNPDLAHAFDAGIIDVTAVTGPTLDGKKTQWVVSDDGTTNLTTGVFREGIDKLVASNSASGTDYTGKFDAVIAALGPLVPADQTAAIAGYVTDATAAKDTFSSGMSGDGKIDTSGLKQSALSLSEAGDSFAIAPDIIALGHTFHLTPFTYFEGFDLKSMLHGCRDMFLLGLCVTFAWFTQEKFEKYSLSFFQTAQATTKPEPAQNYLPGIGWGKQVAMALTISGGYLTVLAAWVTLANTDVGTIVSGVGVFTAIGHVASGITTAIGGPFAAAWSLMDTFFPISAALEFCGLHLFIAWTMPVQWAGCFYLAKFFQL